MVLIRIEHSYLTLSLLPNNLWFHAIYFLRQMILENNIFAPVSMTIILHVFFLLEIISMRNTNLNTLKMITA